MERPVQMIVRELVMLAYIENRTYGNEQIPNYLTVSASLFIIWSVLFTKMLDENSVMPTRIPARPPMNNRTALGLICTNLPTFEVACTST